MQQNSGCKRFLTTTKRFQPLFGKSYITPCFYHYHVVNNKEQPGPLTHRYKSTHFCHSMSPFCPTCSSISAASKVFVLLIHLRGTVDIGGYLTCIGLSGQGKRKSCSVKLERDGPLLSANALSSQRRRLQAIVWAGMFLFTHPFVCLFPGAPERKPVRSGPSRFTSVRSWNSVLTSLSLLITCPWPPLPHRWLSFICFSCVVLEPSS